MCVVWIRNKRQEYMVYGTKKKEECTRNCNDAHFESTTAEYKITTD